MNRFVVCLVAIAASVSAQLVPQMTCDATGDPLQFRSEGLAERLGRVVLTCEAPLGAAGGQVSGSLSLFISQTVTNRLNGNVVDATLTADTAAGRVPVGGAPLLIGRNNIIFEPFTFTLPASGRTNFVIDNIRAAGDPGLNRPVTATLTTSGSTGIGVRNNPVTIGIPGRGLFASNSSARIVCTGSTLPEDIFFTSLVGASVRFATIRVTEGFPTAFEPRATVVASPGTRIVVRYAGMPPAARLYVPDFIAGSSAVIPTSAGDLGWSPSGGQYAGGGVGSALVLSRVFGTDPAGNLGDPRFPTTGFFNSVSEVPLFGGNGSVVYEVIDSNGQALESAQIATFIALPKNTGQDGTVATAQVTFGPISTVTEATSGAPVPRFRDIAPQNDCTVLRDCTASYFPKLIVDAPEFDFTVNAANPGFYQKFLRVLNDNTGSLMNWTTAIAYRNGAGWLRIFPEAGVNNASLNLTATPEKLAPGYYEATLTIDAGPIAGTKSYTVRLNVLQALPPPVQPPVLRLTSNLANESVTTVVPGSLARLRGQRLIGRTIQVTFDGIAATVIASATEGNEQRLDVLVPAELGFRQTALVQVTADGVASVAQTVGVSPAAPAIFPGGVYNQNGRANTEGNPETTGNVMVVYATGLPSAGLGFISAKIHDREITEPLYAGPAPSLSGIQQVNFTIPEDLPTMNTEVLVCGVPANNVNSRTCSRPVVVTIRERPEQ